MTDSPTQRFDPSVTEHGMTTGMSRTPIDTSKPHSVRVYDWLLGGKDNYPVDQAVAEHLPAEAKIGALQNRAFMSRATAWLAGEGIGPEASGLYVAVARVP